MRTYAAVCSMLLIPGLLMAQNRRPRVEYLTPSYTQGQNLPFSEAVRVGNMLYLSGAIGIKPGTMELVPGGLEPQARQTLANIESVLKHAGASRNDVVKCTVMLADIKDWPKFNAVYVEFFKDHRPARSALGANGLALGATVEIECLAVAPAGRSQ